MEHDHAPAPTEVAAAPTVTIDAPAPGGGSVPVTGVAVPAAGDDTSAADPLGGSRAPDTVVDALQRRRGQGTSLPADVAQRFGEQLATDLGPVRVHTDSEADRITRSVGAAAFTYGSDVYFSHGQYTPGTTGGAGEHVLAHELAHVAQQRGGGVAAPASGPVIGRADDPAEADADRQADRTLSALRRQAVASPEPIGLDEAAPLRRLTVAELVARHEQFIEAAGGATAAAAKADTDTEDHKTDGEDHTTETEGEDLKTEGEDLKTEGEDHKTDTDGEDHKTDGEDHKTEGEDHKTDTDGEDHKTDGEDHTTDGEDHKTDTDGEDHKTDGEDLTTDEGEVAEVAGEEPQADGLPSPALVARIDLHARALAMLSAGRADAVTGDTRAEIQDAVLALLGRDPWIEAMRLLDFDDLFLFVRHRHERLVAAAQPKKEDAAGDDGKGDADSDTIAAVVDAAAVALESGMLHRGDDGPQTGPADTSQSTAPTVGKGFEILVVGTGFEMRMASETDLRAGDTDPRRVLMPDQKPVITAAIAVRGGAIDKMVNIGSAATPSLDEFVGFLLHLQESGLSLDFLASGFAGLGERAGTQILAEYTADLRDEAGPGADEQKVPDRS